MIIAVPYENGSVFSHFGKTQEFKLYFVENNCVIKTEMLDTLGEGHGALVRLLQSKNVDLLICGGLGQGARNALEQNNIKVYPGVNMSTDEAVDMYLKGTLKFSETATCNHHDGGHDCNHPCSK